MWHCGCGSTIQANRYKFARRQRDGGTAVSRSKRGPREAFGKPGIEPRWTHGGKDGVGTAYSASARVWFTVWNGILTEVYYPTVDRPQLRDLQLLITDGRTFFHEEKRNLRSRFERLSDHTLGYRAINSDPDGRYEIVKEIIADPHQCCVLQRVELRGDEGFLAGLRLYVLCAPHLEVGGWGNHGYVTEAAGRRILVAEKQGTWLALAATVPFSQLSCGYVGASDGWTDLHEDFRMDWEFDRAPDGNIALTGHLDLGSERGFTLGLAFGESLHNATTTLLQSLATPFEKQHQRYDQQWERACRKFTLPLGRVSGDGGNLFHSSCSLLLAHEDKSYPGAFIASMSIPWGESKGDEDMGGYHLVWTRDLVNSATGLLAAGDVETPLRALIYLAVCQQEDGGFPQNFWIDGDSYWQGIQLDEVAFPILLAWQLRRANALQDFDPYPMVLRAASFLVQYGPVTEQERWEEASGYSPSTLGANIAALVCAGRLARERGDPDTAQFIEEFADFLECHLESWTVTTAGTLVPGIPRHFIRILPASVNDPSPREDPNEGVLALANQPPGGPYEYPAREIVDAGFLDLVRFGVRKADDALMRDSLAVVDAVLKADTPWGPCWRRYSHDGYGQRDDGGPYEGWGRGRAWPLLTGERAHYELAAGRDVSLYIRAIEGFASSTGLLPEQVWDAPDLPEAYMFLGRPTGAAMPLMWAHAEYIRLLRSVSDGQVFSLIPDVAERYLGNRRSSCGLEVWKFNRQVRTVQRGRILRVIAGLPFELRWTMDEWQTSQQTPSRPTAIEQHWVDVAVSPDQQAPVRFTIFWPAANRWEGSEFKVDVGP
jgi:glucoamylase